MLDDYSENIRKPNKNYKSDYFDGNDDPDQKRQRQEERCRALNEDSPTKPWNNNLPSNHTRW